jgi:two-component system response regulator HydG/two-component system response regulator AtoC
LQDFPEQFRNKFQSGGSDTPSELDSMISALFAANWNKSLAAQKLKWSRMTLYRKMAKYRLAPGGDIQPVNCNNLGSDVTGK